MTSSYNEFEFTAFSESDMLAAGAGNGNYLSNGETLTMPGAASAVLSVSDNDATLSGDSRCNENANDHSGQTAGITVNGQPAGNGGQIYAECYYWLRDGDGNWYLLIEIEQEGTGDNYFTFCDAYGCGVPAAGTELTVYCSGNVSCWEPSFDCLGAGGGGGAPNAAPIAADDAFTTDEDTGISGDLLSNDSDANDTELTVAEVSFGAVGEATAVTTDSGAFTGTLTVNADGTFTFEPGADLNDLRVGATETVTFSYTITDDEGATDTASVTITIEGLNEAPIAENDIVAVFSGNQIGDGDSADGKFNILENDSDPEGDEFFISAVNGGDIGEDISIETAGGRMVTFSVDDEGAVSFDTGTDFKDLGVNDTDSFTFSYTIEDENGASDVGLATVVITGSENGDEESLEATMQELVEWMAVTSEAGDMIIG